MQRQQINLRMNHIIYLMSLKSKVGPWMKIPLRVSIAKLGAGRVGVERVTSGLSLFLSKDPSKFTRAHEVLTPKQPDSTHQPPDAQALRVS